MAISNNISNAQMLNTMSLMQEKPVESSVDNGWVNWPPETSAMGVITKYLARVASTDVALVGDLMINGRRNAVLAQNPPSGT